MALREQIHCVLAVMGHTRKQKGGGALQLIKDFVQVVVGKKLVQRGLRTFEDPYSLNESVTLHERERGGGTSQTKYNASSKGQMRRAALKGY